MGEKNWQLQEVKSHLSEVVRRAEAGETTIVTRHGEKTAVILSYGRYLELTRRRKNLLDTLRAAPPMDELPLERSRELVKPNRLE